MDLEDIKPDDIQDLVEFAFEAGFIAGESAKEKGITQEEAWAAFQKFTMVEPPTETT